MDSRASKVKDDTVTTGDFYLPRTSWRACVAETDYISSHASICVQYIHSNQKLLSQKLIIQIKF